MNHNDTAILKKTAILSADYGCIVSGLSKRESIDSMHFIDLTKNMEHYQR